jgi:cytochrome P450
MLADPEQQALAREDPENLAEATDESLRWTSPMYPRVVHEDTELGGVHLPAGTRIGVLIASPNRDERHWEDPDRFDRRRATVRHLAFSRGPHVCPGAYVARQQITHAALPALLTLPGIRLATTDVRHHGWVSAAQRTSTSPGTTPDRTTSKRHAARLSARFTKL